MIRYQHGAISFTLADDVSDEAREIAAYAATTYGFVLNTPKHRNRWRTWRRFAAAVKQTCSMDDTRNRQIVEVLKSL